MYPHFHGVRTRFQHSQNTLMRSDFIAKCGQRSLYFCWMMGEIIVNRHALNIALHFQTAFCVNKCPQCSTGIFNTHARMMRRRNRHQAVTHIVLAYNIPMHLCHFFTLMEHSEFRAIVFNALRIPCLIATDILAFRPTPHCQGLLYAFFACKRQNSPIVWNGANHVVELALNGFQVIKNIRMVKTNIINN